MALRVRRPSTSSCLNPGASPPPRPQWPLCERPNYWICAAVYRICTTVYRSYCHKIRLLFFAQTNQPNPPKIICITMPPNWKTYRDEVVVLCSCVRAVEWFFVKSRVTSFPHTSHALESFISLCLIHTSNKSLGCPEYWWKIAVEPNYTLHNSPWFYGGDVASDVCFIPAD